MRFIVSCQLLVLVLLCGQALATQISWIKLQANFSYRDLKQTCTSTGIGSQIYFAAELEKDLIVRAALNKYQSVSSPKYSYVFSEDELKDITPYRDPYGNVWLKELRLSGPASSWVFEYADDYYCHPSKPTKTVVPSPAVFYFETDSLGHELAMSLSNEVAFNGVLSDERPYEATLQLTETLY